MKIKSIIQKIKRKFIRKNKNTQNESQNKATYLSACILTQKTKLIDVPSNKYVIIDKLCLHNDIYNKRFVFKINENGSHKVDDIICCGALKTRHVTIEVNYQNGQIEDSKLEIITDYLNEDKYYTLRDIVKEYFPSMSLSNIRYTDSYMMTKENIVRKAFLQYSNMPTTDIVTHMLVDTFLKEICEYID